jgi:Mrp family chromosome partitioning ATPase
MSRLLQALKNLESRQPEAKSSAQATVEQRGADQQPGELELVSAGSGAKGLLAHLADRLHTPSPDPAPTPRTPARPTPIERPEASGPLAKLSAGIPAAWLAGPPAELLAGPPEELLTAFESLPAMTHEAAALARPAERSSPPVEPRPPAATSSAPASPSAAEARTPTQPAEPAAQWPEPPRLSALDKLLALDKLSARWPISEPLPTSRASTPLVAPCEPAADIHVEQPVEPPATLPEPTPAVPVVHREPVVARVVVPAAEVAPVAELAPFSDEPAADEPVAEEPAGEESFAHEPVTHEPTIWVDREPIRAQQAHDDFRSHTHTLPPLASSQTASPTPTAARTPAPQTLVERTTRRTLSDPQRAEPYRQVAERIVRDLAHVAGRSAVLAGVGSASDTNELVLVAAAALENAGGSVLVIDGDTAHRSLTTQLDLSDARGLAELLRERDEPARYIRKLSVGGLSFLPIGKTRFPEPEPVASQLAALVQSLEAEYSLVLIDGGRTTELAAATLARLADATYFVIRLGHTEASVAQNALRDFRAAGARVLGCVATS